MPVLFLAVLVATSSCSSDEEPAPNPTYGLTAIAEGYTTGIKVGLWAPEALFAGYNLLYLHLIDSTTGKAITDADVQLHPLMQMASMSHSCPVEEPMYDPERGLFTGAAVFTMPSGDMGSWTLSVNVTDEQSAKSGPVEFDIHVLNASPARLQVFQTETGQKFFMSYRFVNSMQVGVNDFEVIVFTYQEGAFVPAENLIIKFTPEMPSMDHGSPNNEDPVHIGGGHYKGKANFTMTGDWRLHLELKQEDESVLATKYFDVVVE